MDIKHGWLGKSETFQHAMFDYQDYRRLSSMDAYIYNICTYSISYVYIYIYIHYMYVYIHYMYVYIYILELINGY